MNQEQQTSENNLADNNGNMIIELLFQAHAMNTINSPLIINTVTGDLRKIKNNIIINGTDSVFDEVLEEFKTSFTCYCTVHHEPNFWRSIFGKSFYDTQKIKNYINMQKGDDTIVFDDYEYIVKIPNGCCTTEQCPVKKFYEIYNFHLLDN